jgi:protocatechuate 3,4-dioxygenase beta subunit
MWLFFILAGTLGAEVTPPPPPLVLEGTVRGPEGQPVDKALVLARLPAEPALLLTARTGPTGRFTIAVERKRPLDVTVEAPGFPPAVLTKALPGAPLAFVLKRGRVLEGIVRDFRTRRPVSGARVEARGGAARTLEPESGVVAAVTDSEGHFRLEGVANTAVTVVARHHSLGRAERYGLLDARPLTLFLVPSGTISGSITDEAKRPVGSAVLWVERSPERHFQGVPSVRSDSKGHFEVSGLDPGTYTLYAVAPGFALGVTRGLAVSAEEVSGTFVLEPGVTLSGRLIGPRGVPVGGRVSVGEIAGLEPPAALNGLLTVEAGSDGRFRLDHVPPGPGLLKILSPRLVPRSVLFDASTGSLLVLGDVALEPGLTIAGRVRNKGGSPIADADVACAPSQGTTAADGSFLIGGLSPGPCHLVVNAPGFSPLEASYPAGASNLDLVLMPAAVLRGRVVDDRGAPMEAARVTAQIPKGSYRRTSTDASGRFSFDDLSAGTYVVEASVAGWASQNVSGVRVNPPSPVELGDLRLTKGGTVRGTVADTSGKPVVGASVTSTDWQRASTDETGAFLLTGLRPGPVAVDVSHPSFAPSRKVIPDVDPLGAPSEVSLVLGAGGRIDGLVTARDPNALAGLFVATLVTGANDQPQLITTSVASDGTFTVDHLLPGHASLDLRSGADFVSPVVQNRSVDIEDGGLASVTFTLRNTEVSGIVSHNRAPIVGATVVFQDVSGGYSYGLRRPTVPSTSGPQFLAAVTGDDGSYVLLTDHPGTYMADVTPQVAGGLQGRLVTVPDADVAVVNLSFGGPVLSGIVVDKATNEPLGGAGVSAALVQGGDSPPPMARVQCGPDGRFHVELDPGSYRVTGFEDGYAMASSTVTVSENGGTVTIALNKAGGLKGQVVDRNGRGVGGVEVSVMSTVGAGMSLFGAVSLPDGSFAFNIPRGPYTLFAGSGIAGFGVRSEATAGSDPAIVTLLPAGQATIRVVDAKGAPVEDALFEVTQVDGVPIAWPLSDAGRSDSKGMLHVALPAGAVGFNAFNNSYSGQGTIQVSPAGMASAEVVVAPEKPKSP